MGSVWSLCFCPVGITAQQVTHLPPTESEEESDGANLNLIPN